MSGRMQAIELALIVLIVSAVGCGGGLPMVKVSGQVTFDGGDCPAPGRLTFTPIETEPGLPVRAGSAQFKQDGRFMVTSFKEGDGLLPGRYEVKVTCMRGMPDFSKPNPLEAVSYVAKGYQPEELMVEKGRSLRLTYDVPQKN